MRGAQKWGKVLVRAYLRANSVLRRANVFGMSKIDVNPHSLPMPSFNLPFISKIQRITSHFILEAAVKVP